MTVWITNVFESIFNFSNILNSGIAASWLILAVVIFRVLLKKAPKWIHVALWGLVAVRLLLPLSIESRFSLIPSAETIPQEILRYEGEGLQESAYLDVITNPLYSSGFTAQLNQTVDRLQVHLIDVTLIWLAGATVLLLYTAISYLRLRRKLDTAVWHRGRTWKSERVSSPFLLGFRNPRIYVPFKMDEQTLAHVVAHEQAHLHRKDHWWKLLGFLLLAIHWFNPLMWLAYALLCRDIELACDEKVIKELDHEQRADYTQALVSCSVNRHIAAACPLAFGEVGVKERVKSVLHYKKPAFWIMVPTAVACLVVVVCFLTNPKEPSADDIFHRDGYTILEQKQIPLTLTISKDQLPDDIYTNEGYEFAPEEVVAYRSDTTTIYLASAMLSNESDELLYFSFDCAFDLPNYNYGSLITSLYVNVERNSYSHKINLLSEALTDGRNIYPDALDIRGTGPGSMFVFYVSKDALQSAEGNIMIDIECNQLTYAKKGYEKEAAQLIFNGDGTR
ncbi:MAG: hypothetical protein IJZ84_05935 [Lachnospiraceae bacterium]|nr:hypothetical protein [Lachnospiraceae bacterium]